MKTIEVKILLAEFRSKCHYRIKLDTDAPTGGAVTSWSDRTSTPEWSKVLLVNQADNKKILKIAVEAMVKGEAKVIAEGTVEGEPMLKVTEGVCDIPIGQLKISYRHLKQDVLQTLSMGSNSKSIVGFSVSAGLSSAGDAKFDDIKLKLRNTEGTVYGHAKITSTKPTAFIQLDDHQANDCVAGNCMLSVLGDSTEGAGGTPLSAELPIPPGSLVSALPMYNPEGQTNIILTSQILSDQSYESGVVHDIETTLEWLEENDEDDIDANILSTKDLESLKKPMVCHYTFPEAPVSEEDILKNCMKFPYESSSIKDVSKHGYYTIMPKVDPESRNDEAKLNARMLANIRGNLTLPRGRRDTPLELICTLLDLTNIDDDIKKVVASGSLKEVKRIDNSHYNGITTVLEGDFKMTDDAIASKLLENNIKISMRFVCSVLSSEQAPEEQQTFDPDSRGDSGDEAELEKEVKEEEELVKKKKKKAEEEAAAAEAAAAAVLGEAESEKATTKAPSRASSKASLKSKSTGSLQIAEPEQDEDQDEKSGEEWGKEREEEPKDIKKKHQKHKKKAKSRNNHPEEMPGMSDFEDIVHDENMRNLYDSFGNLYDEDEADFSPMGSPGRMGEGFSPKQIVASKRASKAGTALAHVIKAELVEKQRLINRLMDEAGARGDAIDLCGKEIRALREEVSRHKSKADDATAEIARYEKDILDSSKFVENTVGSPEELSALNRATLIHVVLDLGERLKKSDKERVELKKISMEGQAARAMYLERQQQLNDLTEAHMHQSHFIQKLQKKINKMDNYKSTIKLQENIIAKMQRVIEAHLKLSRRNDGSGSSEQNELFDKLMGEIERSESESREEQANREAERAQELALRQLNTELAVARRDTTRLEKESENLRERLRKAEDKAEAAEQAVLTAKNANAKKDKGPVTPANMRIDADGELVEISEGQARVDEMEVELTSCRYRIEALEGELELSAQENGKEIARLRTRLFDFEMAAMFSEAQAGLDGFNFEGGNAGIAGDDFIKPVGNAPAGTGMDAAKELKAQSPTANSEFDTPENDIPKEEEEEEKEEWHEHEEVSLPIPIKIKKAVVGNCQATFKFRYFGKLGKLEEDHDMEIVVTKVELLDCKFDDESKRIFCDLSFGSSVWSAKTKTKDASENVTWDYKTEEYGDHDSTLDETPDGEKKPFNHQMRFQAPFGACSTENLLVVCMVEHEDIPNALFGSGHSKLVNLEHCAEFKTKDGKHVEEVLPDGESPRPSPRPVPTGKLHHNMMILNSALRVIGKTMAYADDKSNQSSRTSLKSGTVDKDKSIKSGVTDTTAKSQHSAYGNKENILKENDV